MAHPQPGRALQEIRQASWRVATGLAPGREIWLGSRRDGLGTRYTGSVADSPNLDRAAPAEPTEEAPAERPRLTPEMIEKLRQTGIRLDRQGRLWHAGTEITHPGLCRALLRWLDLLPDGRPILRLDARRYAYLEVEDAHLLVLSARWQGERAFVRLNDGTEEELDYASLRVGAEDALYCRARGGSLRARVTTPAYHALAERIVEVAAPKSDADEPGFALRANGRTYQISE